MVMIQQIKSSLSMRQVFFLACLFVGTLAMGQQYKGTYWHNGATFITVLEENVTDIVTVEGNLHEGGNAQSWAKAEVPGDFLRPNQIGNAWTDTIIHYNDLIIHKTIGGQECLLVYGRTRTLEDILLRYDGHSANKWYEHSHGFDSVLEADIHRQIEGTYRDGLEAWRITHDSILIYSLSSLPGQPHRSYAYTIRWGETDMPEHVLSLSDGRKLCFTLTAEGLDFYNGISHVEDNDFEWISQGDLLCHLVKTGLDNQVPGRWPEASSMLLTRGYLKAYPSEVLRLIRNEIFARHGRTFSDPKLTAFFHSDGLWYGTALTNPTLDQLSYIEELNLQLIGAVENERKQASTNR